MARLTLNEVKGLGPSTIAELRKAGFTSVKSVASSSIESLTAIDGFGVVRSRTVKAAAEALLRSASGEKELVPMAPTIKQQKETEKDKKRRKEEKKKPKKKAKKEKSKKKSEKAKKQKNKKKAKSRQKRKKKAKKK